MAYTAPSDAPRARPSTVTFAVYLLYLAAALQALSMILGLVYYGALKKGADKAAELVAGTDMSSQTGGGAAGQAGGIAIGVILIAILVTLAVLVSRGNRVGRILTWVLGGLGVCCLGGVYGLSLFASAGFDQARKTDPKVPTWDQYSKALYSEVPGWYPALTNVILIVTLLSILGAIVLLALPPSHPFFRKVEAQWEPPVPPSAGPSGPGQFGQPGGSDTSWPPQQPPTSNP